MPATSRTLTFGRVSIQLSVSIYIISVNLHAFLLAVIIECVLLHFACYYILIRFSICRMILKSVASHSYAELRGNNLLEHEEQSRIRSRSRWQMSVDYFRSIECKSPGDVADMGIHMMSIIWYRNKLTRYELPQSRLRYWRYIWRYGVV